MRVRVRACERGGHANVCARACIRAPRVWLHIYKEEVFNGNERLRKTSKLACRLGRECPDMPCDVVFHASEWKAVCMVRNQTEAPDVPPRLNDMIRWIAAMGGHVIRSTTKAQHPGTQTLWLGLQRVNDLAIAWNTYGPGKINPTPKSLMPRKRCVVR